jgi:hypothetical protein
MQSKLERMIRALYKKRPSQVKQLFGEHPDDEAFSCYCDGALGEDEARLFKQHILVCKACSQKLGMSIESVELKGESQVPQGVLSRAHSLLDQEQRNLLLEVALKVKEKIIEVISTTGEVLVGQELVAAPLLRSRNIKDFKDEVTIFKDFKDIVVELKIENKGARYFDMTVVAKKKNDHKLIKDLRVTLFRETKELESYIASAGLVTFEHVRLGSYRVEISDIDTKRVSIALDIKI